MTRYTVTFEVETAETDLSVILDIAEEVGKEFESPRMVQYGAAMFVDGNATSVEKTPVSAS